MATHSHCLILLALLLCWEAAGGHAMNLATSGGQLPRAPTSGHVVFSDDFTASTLDTSKWRHDVTAAAGDFSMFTPEPGNTFVRNGILYIKPTLTADHFGENFLTHGTLNFSHVWGTCTLSYNQGCVRTGKDHNIPPIMSARIYSRVAISHGRVEVVARLPKGDWLWPAIWLLPDRSHTKYGGWPQSGEIDIMESRGNTNLKDKNGHDHGVQNIFSTIHYGPHDQHIQHGGSKSAKAGQLWSDDYHTYTLDWTTDHIRVEVDGEPMFAWSTPKEGYFTHENFTGTNIWSSGGPDAPFDGKFYLILNVAVGDKDYYFNDAWVNHPYPKPWKNADPLAMVDFWNKRHQWLSTWHGDDVALRIKSVKMYQY